MAPQCLPVELRSLGSGTGPQTPSPTGRRPAATAHLRVTRANRCRERPCRLRLLPDQEPGSALCELCWPAPGPAFKSF